MSVIVQVETEQRLEGWWGWDLILIGEAGAAPILHGIELFPTKSTAEFAARHAINEIAQADTTEVERQVSRDRNRRFFQQGTT